MEFNPYQPPQSALSNEPLKRRGRLYLAANYLYAALLAACTCILLIGTPPRFDLSAFFVVLFFYAPVICFCLIRWGAPTHLKKSLIVYGVLVLALITNFFWNLTLPDPDPGIGAVIVGINVLALGGALLQMRPNSSLNLGGESRAAL